MRPLFFLPFICGAKKDRFTPACHNGQFKLSTVEKMNDSMHAKYSTYLDHRWGACVMQGHRNHMEDRIITNSYFENMFSLYIVFDGHGGDAVVKYAESEFSSFLLEQGKALFEAIEKDVSNYDPEKIKTLLEEAFPIYDRMLMQKEDIHQALLGTELRSTSGCTCTGVILTHEHAIIFNAGDSRTIAINANNAASGAEKANLKFATKDHKPDDPGETRRINASGGYVSMPPETYIPRVNGQLALSRAFGDFQLKINGKKEQHEQAVITDPDVTILDRKTISHIVIASDGIYDGLENEMVMLHAVSDTDIEARANNMLYASLHNKSGDNMAAVIIELEGQNQPEVVDSGYETGNDEL